MPVSRRGGTSGAPDDRKQGVGSRTKGDALNEIDAPSGQAVRGSLVMGESKIELAWLRV